MHAQRLGLFDFILTYCKLYLLFLLALPGYLRQEPFILGFSPKIDIFEDQSKSPGMPITVLLVKEKTHIILKIA